MHGKIFFKKFLIYKIKIQTLDNLVLCLVGVFFLIFYLTTFKQQQQQRKRQNHLIKKIFSFDQELLIRQCNVYLSQNTKNSNFI